MKSESSCTYKELVLDYASTLDSTAWQIQYVTGSFLNNQLGIEQIPVSLTDGTQDDFIDVPIVIGMTEIEEMIMEPLLAMPSDSRKAMDHLTGCTEGELYIAASSYGCKNLVFSFSGCLLAVNDSSMCLYFPKRLMKRMMTDCKDRGIECEFASPDKSSTYVRMAIPSILRHDCEIIFSNSPKRHAKPMLTPVYKDGFKIYSVVQTAVCVFLSQGKHINNLHDDGNTIIIKRKRQLTVFPLGVTAAEKICNVVADNTNSND